MAAEPGPSGLWTSSLVRGAVGMAVVSCNCRVEGTGQALEVWAPSPVRCQLLGAKCSNLVLPEEHRVEGAGPRGAYRPQKGAKSLLRRLPGQANGAMGLAASQCFMT